MFSTLSKKETILSLNIIFVIRRRIQFSQGQNFVTFPQNPVSSIFRKKAFQISVITVWLPMT